MQKVTKSKRSLCDIHVLFQRVVNKVLQCATKEGSKIDHKSMKYFMRGPLVPQQMAACPVLPGTKCRLLATGVIALHCKSFFISIIDLTTAPSLSSVNAPMIIIMSKRTSLSDATVLASDARRRENHYTRPGGSS